MVLENDPTAHAELLAVRDACRRLKTRDLSDCEVYSTATPCPMCQAALYWAARPALPQRKHVRRGRGSAPGVLGQSSGAASENRCGAQQFS